MNKMKYKSKLKTNVILKLFVCIYCTYIHLYNLKTEKHSKAKYVIIKKKLIFVKIHFLYKL